MHKMSMESRKKHLSKILQLDVGARQLPTEAAKAGQLSVSYTDAKVNVTDSLLASIWTKASEYLANDDSIIQLPRKDEDEKKFFVYSRSKPDNPNTVTLANNGKMSCSCLMFRSTPNLCSHSVAVAEKETVLKEFLSWVAQSDDSNLYR